MKILTSILALCLSLAAMAASFDELVFDQDQKSNLKKLGELSKKRARTILWWNVAWGHYNGDGSLDKNLLGLVNSKVSPDVIVMGEYKPQAFTMPTIAALELTYPHMAFVPSEPGDATGVVIWSKHPFKSSAVYPLDWTSMRATATEQEAYRNEWTSFDPGWVKYWNRAFAHYEVAFTDGALVNVAPVHLCSPWSTVFKKIGTWKTLRTMMGAQDNPLLFQQQRLLEDLKRDFGANLDRAPLILIGDFNVPAKIPVPIVGGTPKQFKLLRGPLEDAVDNDDDTFPTKSTAHDQSGPLKNHSIKIDHAFYNKKIKGARAEVLNLKGSDHYPVLMQID